MTREDIICMGAESKISLYSLGKEKEKFINYLESFAYLVASSEREACAKVCDNRVTAYKYATDVWAQEHINEARHLAKAIRARGQA
jgi:hypothetical protein